MDTVIAAPASCEVRAVIRFLHAEGQSAAALWRYDNAFIFTNQSEVDFGITLVSYYDKGMLILIGWVRSRLKLAIHHPVTTGISKSKTLRNILISTLK